MVDAVRHVPELLRLHGALILKDIVAQNVGVQGAHAVDGHAAGDAEVRHAHLTVPDDGQLARFGGVVVVILDFFLIAARNLRQNRPDARQERLHQLLRPAFERLGKHRVVRVGDGMGRDVPRRVPVKPRVVHQDAHELWNDERGMRVVDLDDVLFVEVHRCSVKLNVLAHDGLHRGRNEKVLLL